MCDKRHLLDRFVYKTKIVEVVRKEGTILEFQRYTGVLEKCQNYLCVGYMFLSYLGMDNNIIKVYKSKTPFNAGWNNVQDVLEHCGGTFKTKQVLIEPVWDVVRSEGGLFSISLSYFYLAIAINSVHCREELRVFQVVNAFIRIWEGVWIWY